MDFGTAGRHDSGKTFTQSARQPERLGHPVADRLGGFGHDLLGQRRKFLDLRRRKLELLALMRERQLEQFGRRLRLESPRARSNAVLAFCRAISISLTRYSAEPRVAQEHRLLECLGRVLHDVVILSCMSLVRASDFSNRSMNDDGISVRKVSVAASVAA